MNCSQCNSINIVRNGSYKFYQKYKCKNCGKQFSERSFSFFCRHRFSEFVIRNTILYNFFVSTRKSVFLAKETMNITLSHQSAYNWSKKFAKFISKLTKEINASNIWHVDEKFVKCRNQKDKYGKVKFSYLWAVLDNNNNLLATYVSNYRNIRSAEIVLRKAKKKARRPPDIIVTDGLQAYNKACKSVFGRKTKHVVRHFESKAVMCKGKIYYLSNNRIECLNSKINLWYKKFRGFKSLETANLWCEMFNFFYNYIRPRVIEHNLISIKEIIVR